MVHSMAEEWKFTFEQVGGDTKDVIPSEAKSVIGSGSKEKSKKNDDGDGKSLFSRTIDRTSDKLIEEMGLSSLNTMTGGFANPIYKSTKRLMTGASLGSVAGGFIASVSMIALTQAISALEKRMDNLQTQVTNLGNTDNALIRAGSVSQATYYSANIFGIKKKTNRS